MADAPKREKRIYGDDGREYDSVEHEAAVLRLERAAPELLAALVAFDNESEWLCALAKGDAVVNAEHTAKALLAQARAAIAKAQP